MPIINPTGFLRIALFVISFSIVNSHVDKENESFKGESEWFSDELEQCISPVNQYYQKADLGCYTYFVNDVFDMIRVELLSRDPVLLVYRKLANSRNIERMLEEIREKDLSQQEVLNEDGGVKLSEARQVNGTWFRHKETQGFANFFKRVQKANRHVNFRISENWNVLSYHPGGHYAVHSDFLPENDETVNRTLKYGNRWATFLVVLKTADVGGGTVFPNIETTVIPEPGDAMLWTNIHTNGTENYESVHGACPIVEGQKIAATLWLREKNQPLLAAGHGEKFDSIPFLKPSSFSARCNL